MYQHTNVKFYEAQLHPSPKERDSPPRPRRAPSAPITSWPEPAAATAALQRPVPSPDPQNTTLTPLKRTPSISAGVGGARGHGREEAANPPRCDTRFPAPPGPHAASPPSLPPARPDGARRRFPARPGGELRSPAPKDEPPAGSDLAGAGGGGRWPGRGQGGGEPPPHPAVTGEEMRENPRCSRRRRERRVTGERRRAGTMRKQKMQVKRRLPRDPEGPAVGAGSGGPEGAAPGRTTTPAAPRDNEGTRGRGGGRAAAGLPQARLHRQSPAATPAPALHRPRTGPQQPEPALRRARHDVRAPRRAGSARDGPPGARRGAAAQGAEAAQSAERSAELRPAPGAPRDRLPRRPPRRSLPAAGHGRFPPTRAYLAGPFPGPLRGTRPGSAPRRVPGSRRQRALGRGGGGPSPGGGGGFSPGRAETALGARGSPAPAPGAPRPRPPRSPLAAAAPRPAPPGRPPSSPPLPPSFAIGDPPARLRPRRSLIGRCTPAPPLVPRSRRPIGVRGRPSGAGWARCRDARGREWSPGAAG
ncbi:translation initiation factor IF-2-like [Pipra filicauda]|uniref:Translation initiation factor IF-2-like n=1 Tax=Pipra filicauda TaxID=649802 RepID=A0A7R5KCT9_9PASS|nr:translation initiation factor IF-2-like [Pipra filicauda]